jgi:hypothetical protein
MNIKQTLEKARKNKNPNDIMVALSTMVEEFLQIFTKKQTEDLDKKLNDSLNEVLNQIKGMKDSLDKQMLDELNAFIVKESHRLELKGDPGYTPIKDVDYFDGYTPQKNKDYFDGKPGADAVVDYEKIVGTVIKYIGDQKDTPDDIVRKIGLSKLKISIDSISKLTEEIALIKKVVSTKSNATVKSGGMGDWIHQQFSVNSTSTYITLSSRVAANGTAHLFRYQGQVLAMNVDYSVNGKVVTFLSPLTDILVDGTTFDATFVRTS